MLGVGLSAGVLGFVDLATSCVTAGHPGLLVCGAASILVIARIAWGVFAGGERVRSGVADHRAGRRGPPDESVFGAGYLMALGLAAMLSVVLQVRLVTLGEETS